MNTSKITNIEAIAILSIIMANKIILNLPETIISSTGSSAWLNIIYIIILAFIFVIISTKLMKNFKNYDILDISEYVGGSFLKSLVGIIQVVILCLIINIVIRNFSDTIKTIYFQQSPIIFIALFLIVASSVANKFGLKTISKVCLYIAPLAFIGLLVLLFTPAKDFEFQRLFPIFGYGIKETFFSGLSNMIALSGLCYIFLIPSFLKDSKDLRKVSLISLSISSIFLFLGIVCMLLVFSFFMNTNENTSLYLLTMVVNHGNLIQGINIIFTLVWILSIISYISIALFFILFVIKKISRISDVNSVNYCISSIFIAISLVLQNHTQIYTFVENTVENTALIFIFIMEPLLFIIANLKQKMKNTELTKNIST